MARNGDAVAALEEMIRRVEAAGPKIAYGGALLVQRYARRHASGPHTDTTLGVISGDLRSSIKARPPRPVGAYTYEAKTFPTVVYARIQELGGHIYPKHLTKKGKLGFLSWVDQGGVRHFSRHVYLPPRPYLRPGLDDAKQPYWELARSRIADALGVEVTVVNVKVTGG